MSLPILLLPLLLLLLVLWSSRVGSTGQRPGESVLCRDTTRLPTKKTGGRFKSVWFLSVNLGSCGLKWEKFETVESIPIALCFSVSFDLPAKYLSLGRRDPARYFHTHNPSSEQYVRLFIKRHITMPRLEA